MFETACGALGGAFNTAAATCAAANCPQPGACCLANGGCVSVLEYRCTLYGGIFKGEGRDCSAGDCWSAPILWHNGSTVTHPGQGFGGADASQVPLGSNVLGESANLASGFHLAEDFTVPQGKAWTVNRFVTYVYQTGAPSSGTITDLVAQIRDGDPRDPASQVIWGDLVTNVRDPGTSGFAGVYRIPAGDSLQNTQRAVQQVAADVGSLQLSSGTYWIEWSTRGSATLGPFIAPVNVLNEVPIGNALIWRNTHWERVVDSQWNLTQFPGGQPLGLPFIIEGTVDGGCYADCNGDEVLNVDDFLCFINAFASQDPYADCSGDGILNVDDFLCFINEFALGCP
jgi:hypothetical protein